MFFGQWLRVGTSWVHMEILVVQVDSKPILRHVKPPFGGNLSMAFRCDQLHRKMRSHWKKWGCKTNTWYTKYYVFACIFMIFMIFMCRYITNASKSIDCQKESPLAGVDFQVSCQFSAVRCVYYQLSSIIYILIHLVCNIVVSCCIQK